MLKVWAVSGPALFPSARRAQRRPRAQLVTMPLSKLSAFDDNGAATNAWQRTAQACHEFEILWVSKRRLPAALQIRQLPCFLKRLDRILHRRRTFNEPRVPTLGQVSSFILPCEGS